MTYHNNNVFKWGKVRKDYLGQNKTRGLECYNNINHKLWVFFSFLGLPNSFSPLSYLLNGMDRPGLLSFITSGCPIRTVVCSFASCFFKDWHDCKLVHLFYRHHICDPCYLPLPLKIFLENLVSLQGLGFTVGVTPGMALGLALCTIRALLVLLGWAWQFPPSLGCTGNLLAPPGCALYLLAPSGWCRCLSSWHPWRFQNFPLNSKASPFVHLFKKELNYLHILVLFLS